MEYWPSPRGRPIRCGLKCSTPRPKTVGVSTRRFHFFAVGRRGVCKRRTSLVGSWESGVSRYAALRSYLLFSGGKKTTRGGGPCKHGRAAPPPGVLCCGGRKALPDQIHVCVPPAVNAVPCSAPWGESGDSIPPSTLRALSVTCWGRAVKNLGVSFLPFPLIVVIGNRLSRPEVGDFRHRARLSTAFSMKRMRPFRPVVTDRLEAWRVPCQRDRDLGTNAGRRVERAWRDNRVLPGREFRLQPDADGPLCNLWRKFGDFSRRYVPYAGSAGSLHFQSTKAKRIGFGDNNHLHRQLLLGFCVSRSPMSIANRHPRH